MQGNDMRSVHVCVGALETDLPWYYRQPKYSCQQSLRNLHCNIQQRSDVEAAIKTIIDNAM